MQSLILLVRILLVRSLVWLLKRTLLTNKWCSLTITISTITSIMHTNFFSLKMHRSEMLIPNKVKNEDPFFLFLMKVDCFTCSICFALVVNKQMKVTALIQKVQKGERNKNATEIINWVTTTIWLKAEQLFFSLKLSLYIFFIINYSLFFNHFFELACFKMNRNVPLVVGQNCAF